MGDAYDALTNHGTVLSFQAILSRFDFIYNDKRPIHILESELSILRQDRMTVTEYYNEVNKKWKNAIVPRLSDTHYSAQRTKERWRNASSKARLKFATYP